MVFVDNSRFLTPRSSFYYPVVPPALGPGEGRKVQVCINEQWIPYILGALEQLVNPYTWKASSDAELTRIEQQANELLYMFQIAQLCGAPVMQNSGGDVEEFLIRQNPDNPCLIETSANGTDWCLLADISLCTPSLQPGGNQRQPAPGGGDVCYSGVLLPQSSFYVPTIVNTGDTIQLLVATGAGTDGTVEWFCPDGRNYFAGICNGSGTVSGADPLPTAKHMAIIAKVGATYIDVSDGNPQTIPGGVLNQQITLQVNDDDLADNAGSYNVSLCVTNNEAGEWASTLNFALQEYADIITAVDYGTWVLGSGYEGTATGDPNSLHVTQIEITLDSCRITSVEMTYNSGGGSGPNQNIQLRYFPGPTSYGVPGVPVSGTNQLYGTVGDVSGVTGIVPGINSGTTDVNVVLKTLVLRGKGPKPSQLP